MADEDMANEHIPDVDVAPEDENNMENLDTPEDRRAAPDASTQRVEDLPYEKRVELARNCPNPFGTLKPGLYVDAVDTINAWCVAQIVEIDDNMVKVHFDGWPPKWDDWMKITSYKIAPFRKNAIGYTGQTKIAIRKGELTPEEYLQLIHKIDICIQNNLKGLGAHETTQFYRGELFCTLDHLMGRSYEASDEALYEVAIKFIKKCLELVATYLKLIPEMLVSLDEAEREPDLRLVDENVAIAACCTEFMEMLKTIYCLNPRTLRFYLKMDRAPADIKTNICKPYKDRDYELQRTKFEELDFDEIREHIGKNKDLDFGLMYEFLDHFQQFDGFDCLRKAIKCIEPSEGQPTLPLDMIPLLTSPFSNCSEVLNQQYAKDMAEETQAVVLGRLENMNEEEMKDIEKSTLNHLMAELRDFLCIALDDDAVDEKLESIKLSMALRFLKSSNMKKRLNGINEIKNIIEMTSNQLRRGWHDDDSPRHTRWIKPEYLCNWIHENKLTEFLLGETSHIEVIKRSANVLRFLSFHKQLTKEHLDLLWKCQEGKHEATVLGVFDTINDIALDLSTESLNYVFTKIQSIPIKKYNEQTLSFVKDFTMNACRVAKNVSRKELVELSSDGEEEEKQLEYFLENAKGIVSGEVTPPTENSSQYGLPIIYEIMQQDTELGSSALKAFIELLKFKCCDIFRMPYILKCIENLQKNVAVYQSLTVMIVILPKCFSNKQFDKRSPLQVALVKLQNDFDLISLTIDDIERYNNKAQDYMIDSVNKGVVPENIPKICFDGNITHADQLEKRLDFIEFLIFSAHGDIKLGNSNIKKLWDIFVKRAGFEFDKNLFFKWLNREKFAKASIQHKEHRRIFTNEEREFLFENILCKPEIVDKTEITHNCFKCFEKFFFFYNRERKYIQYLRGSYKVLEFENINGMETLWEIVILSEDEKVKEDSMYLLSILHLHLDPDRYEDGNKVKVWEHFVNKCLENLKQSNNNAINSAIMLLIKFFDIFDGKNINPQEYSQTNTFPVHIYCADDNLKKVVNIPYTQTVSYLRKMIAEAFDISINEFLLYVNQKHISEDDDETMIREIGFSNMYVIRKIPNQGVETHPKTLLVGNQEFFNLMFDLLSNDEEFDVENIWKLLMKLPQDENPTAKKIENLALESEDNWNDLIDGTSLHKLLYSLQIVGSLMRNGPEWQAQFLNLKGFHHLFKTFLKIDVAKVNSTLAFKSVDLLCKLICEAMEKSPELMATFKQHNLEAIEQLIKLIHQVAKQSISEIKKRGESYDDLYYKNEQFEQKNNRFTSYYDNKSKNENEQEEQSQYARRIQSLSQKFDYVGKFITMAFRMLFHFDTYNNEECISKFCEYSDLPEMLQNILLETDNFNIRNHFGDGIADMLCNQNLQLEKFIEFKKRVLNILIYDISQKLHINPTRSYKYFELLSKLLTATPNTILAKMDIDFEQVLDMNAKLIMDKESTEMVSTDFDTILHGTVKIVRIILQQFPYYKERYGQIMLHFLLKDCLFEVPKSNRSRSKTRPPKCKHQQTRIEVFRLINVLARDCLENAEQVLGYIKSLQEKSSWRTRKQADWCISPYHDEKSTTGYVGVKNLGCVCYMIALLQQLYMIPTFRENVLTVKDQQKNEVPKEDNLLYQLQCLFAFLHLSEQQYYNPQGFTNAFKDWDGNPTNVLVQMDVDEFFNMFMDKLEFAIKGTPQEKMIQQHFGGTYANELICKGCPHYSERSEPYLAVNLQVKNKKSIKESLDALIEGEMLDGDNCYYCEKCDKKVPTLKRTCIKRLPKHLILVLKRFEFDYDTMQKMKVNDYCEFPEEINMEPYTQEGLARREKQTNKDKDMDDDNEETQEDQPKYPLDLYDYRLSGVLVHSGYAEGGHYYSFIKDREDEEGKDKWYEFNDEIVKEFDKSELESECFGGDEKWNDMMGHSIYYKNSEKHRNAYVLFYERISEHEIPYSDSEDESEPNKPEEKEDKDNAGSSDIPMVSDNNDATVSDPKLNRGNIIKIDDEIAELVAEENRKYWQYRFMFALEYSDFILELCSLWNTKNMVLLNYDTRNRDYHVLGIDEGKFKEDLKKVSINYPGNYCANKNIKYLPEKWLLPGESMDLYQKYGGEKVDNYEFEIFKLAATFYLTVKQRATMKEHIPEFLDLIKAHLNKSLRACKWLIMQFSNKEIIEENLLQCSIGDMRKFTVGLLYCAMIQLYKEEKDLLDQYWQYREGTKESLQRCYLGNFVNLLISGFKDTRVYTEFNANYFELLARFASLGKEARLYLLKAKIVGRIMNFYLQDASPYVEYFNDCSDLSFEENHNVELGLPIKMENVKMSMWEELFMKKRDAQIEQGAQNYTYIYETLSLCLRSCVIKAEDAPTFVDDLRYTNLDEKELELLKWDEKDIMGIVDSCVTKLAAKHLGSVFLHLINNNLEMDAMLRQVLIQGINDKQLDDLKPYFPIFKRYLFIQDEHTEERMSEGIREYFTVLKNNIKYASFMSAFIAFMVKLCNINQGIAEILASCPKEWEWVIEWIKKNPCPAKTSSQQFKNTTKIIATSQYYQRRLEDIRDGKIETFEDEYDSDDDMTEHKFYKDEKLDFEYSTQGWTTADVALSLDEMVHIQIFAFNQEKSFWLTIDDERLAPYLKMQERHDIKAIEANKAEIEKQLRKNIQQHEGSGSHQGMSESDRYSHEANENESVSE